MKQPFQGKTRKPKKQRAQERPGSLRWPVGTGETRALGWGSRGLGHKDRPIWGFHSGFGPGLTRKAARLFKNRQNEQNSENV